MKNFLILIFAALFSSNYAIAQFKLTGEIRPRTEFRNGFKAPRNDVPPALFTEQRSRLYFDYKTDDLILKLVIQDVRIWGSVDQIYKTDPNMQNVFEAWGQYNFNSNFGVRAGRMALDYDDARFLGDLRWAQQARSHDAFLFLWKNNKGMKVDVGLAYNQNWQPEQNWLNQNFFDPTVTNNYKTMQFAHFDYQSEKGNIAFLVHNDGRQVASDSSMAYRQTYAVIADKWFGNVKLRTELYHQGGKNGVGHDVNAYLATFYATYKTNLTPITIGGEYLSGTSDEDAANGRNNSFAPLYGTNHKFYGFMDYFFVGSGHANKGLVDLNIKTNFKLGKKANLQARVHHFMTPVDIIDSNTGLALSNSIGTELDFVYIVKPHKDVTVHLGYSQMFSGDSMVEIKGTGDPNLANSWAWLMLTFKPTLFETKIK